MYPKSQPTSDSTIDVNRADAQEWQQLYGIGPVLSGRIVKFRDLLGGFHHIGAI